MPRHPSPTVQATVAPRIEYLTEPNHPQFYFEWHPATGKVYIGAVPGQFHEEVFVPGDFGHMQLKILAEHCDTHARFFGFVQTYLRGYRQGDADRVFKLQQQRQRVVG